MMIYGSFAGNLKYLGEMKIYLIFPNKLNLTNTQYTFSLHCLLTKLTTTIRNGTNPGSVSLLSNEAYQILGFSWNHPKWYLPWFYLSLIWTFLFLPSWLAKDRSDLLNLKLIE
jgi:hypothetical protein